jgi:Skp family chaperone for outer membrane proteins
MKRLALIALAGVLTACSGSNDRDASDTSVEDARREIGEAADATAEALEDTLDEYRRGVARELDEIDREIEELKATAEEKGDEARAKADAALEELDERRRAVARELDKLKSSSGEAWDDVRGGIDRAMADLKNAYEKAKEELERS